MTTEIKTEQAQPSVEELFAQLVPLALAVPKGMFYSAEIDRYSRGSAKSSLSIQAKTQADVKRVRAALGGLWKKNPSGVQWEYRTTLGDIAVHIYACDEAPATCKAVTKTRLATRQVPVGDVQYETREVEEEYTEWDCSNGDTA